MVGPGQDDEGSVSRDAVELCGGRATPLCQSERLVAVVAQPPAVASGAVRRRPRGGDEFAEQTQQAGDVADAGAEHVDVRVGGDEVGVLMRVDERWQDGARREPDERRLRQIGAYRVERARRHHVAVLDAQGLHRGPVVTHVDGDTVQHERPVGRAGDLHRSCPPSPAGPSGPGPAGTVNQPSTSATNSASSTSAGTRP